jgi:DNA topoisomerase-3
VCKREITRDEAEVYRTKHRTELLSDFTSRFGRPFAATLVLQETGRHGFEFQPRAAKTKAGAASEGKAAEAPAKKAASGKRAAAKKGTARKKKATVKKRSAKKPASERARAKGGAKKRSPKKAPKKSTGKRAGQRHTPSGKARTASAGGGRARLDDPS